MSTRLIGMLVPGFGRDLEEVHTLLPGEMKFPEIQKILPKGVSLCIARLPMKKPTYEELFHLADSVEEAASRLADAGVDIIAFGCTAGSFIKGRGYDQEIMNRITQATGVPATTTSTAVVAGLKALGLEKLILVSPYVERMNEIEKAFLEDEGFQVLNYKGLGLDDPDQQRGVEPSRWYELVKEMQQPLSDGYFVSCGGIRVVDIIGQLEMDLGKPVITSNQALVWHCLRRIGIQEPMEGFGRLLKTPLSRILK